MKASDGGWLVVMGALSILAGRALGSTAISEAPSVPEVVTVIVSFLLWLVGVVAAGVVLLGVLDDRKR